MSPRERQLARLLRALIACCALLFAFAPPSFAGGSARDTSGWVAERVTAALVTRAVSRTQPSLRTARRQAAESAPTRERVAPPLGSTSAAPAGRRTIFDARQLYLDLRTLLW
jgi:hypothetical protein